MFQHNIINMMGFRITNQYNIILLITLLSQILDGKSRNIIYAFHFPTTVSTTTSIPLVIKRRQNHHNHDGLTAKLPLALDTCNPYQRYTFHTRQITRTDSLLLLSSLNQEEPIPIVVPSTISTTSTSDKFNNDWLTFTKFIVSCFITAVVIIFYEGIDCAYLKPEAATIRRFPTTTTTTHQGETTDFNLYNYLSKNKVINVMSESIRGMGRGAIDRNDEWYDKTYYGYYPYTNNDDLQNIQSYNEIMEYHRRDRVKRWRMNEAYYNSNPSDIKNTPQTRQYARKDDDVNVKEKLQNSMHSVYVALDIIQQLKIRAADYDWDAMTITLKSAELGLNLDKACNNLQSAVGYIDYDDRMEIGFDWGSCAWRHCGAHADAQEAISELNNSLGMFEPFECLFCLDIIERSLRDIIAVVPLKYHYMTDINQLTSYTPYESQQQITESSASESDDIDSVTTIDQEFINVLANFRNNLSDD